MLHVKLGGPLIVEAGGARAFDIEARTIRELLTLLGDQHPHMRPVLEKGVSVAVNGTIYREAFLTEIPDGAEVFILPQLVGG